MKNTERQKLLRAKKDAYNFYIKEIAESYNDILERKRDILAVAREIRNGKGQGNEFKKIRITYIKETVDLIRTLRQRIDVLVDTVVITKTIIKELSDEK